MRIIGVDTQCHICGDLADTILTKCKLDCDGEEHEFCPTCAGLYRKFRGGLDTPMDKQALMQLTGRREAFILRTRSA